MTAPSTASKPLGANYRKLFSAAVAANLGDGLMSVAMVWLASAVTRDAFVIALIAVAGRIPWLVFSLPAGVITDRFDRRLLVGWMDTVGVVVVGALAVVVWLYQDGLPTPEQLAAGAPEPAGGPVLVVALCVASLLLGFAEVLRDNTAQTLMPTVVDKSQLEKANGRMWAAENTMNNFVGPPLAGVLIGIALVVPFGTNAALLAVSAVLIFSLKGSFTPKGAAGAERGKINWKAEIGEGLSWLWSHKLIRTLAMLLGALNLLSTLAFVLTVLFVQDVLHVYEGWQYGLATTGFAAGAVIGSLVAEKITGRLPPGASLICSIVGMGLSIIGMGLMPWAVAYWLCGVLAGVFIVVWNVITVSLRQRLIPDRLLGRVNSVYRFFGWGTITIGTLLGGALVSALQPAVGREWALRWVFIVAGIGHLALVGIAVRNVNTAKIREAEALAEQEALAETDGAQQDPDVGPDAPSGSAGEPAAEPADRAADDITGERLRAEPAPFPAGSPPADVDPDPGHRGS